MYEVENLGDNCFSISTESICQLVWSVCELVNICGALNSVGLMPSNDWTKLIGE